MAKRPKRKKTAQLAAGELGPTRQRQQRGEVERVPHAIADEDGRPSLPFRAVDTLARMERGGTITREMRGAGEKFRDDFAVASLDRLRAASLLRVVGGAESSLTFTQMAARDRIWKVLQILGGPTSPAALCVWYVIGVGMTVTEWAAREGWNGRPLHEASARGILIGALGALVKHYR